VIAQVGPSQVTAAWLHAFGPTHAMSQSPEQCTTAGEVEVPEHA
jgi:hypothetical protein